MNLSDETAQLHELLATQIEFLNAEMTPSFGRLLDLFAVRPTLEELRQILEECFWASHTNDEGRPTRFVVSFLPSALQPDTASGFIAFSVPLPLTRENLRRLAPAAPPENSVLYLRRTEEGVKLAGILSFADNYGRPIAVSIGVSAPGALTVSFNNKRLMSIQRGHVALLKQLPLDDRSVKRLLSIHQRREDGDLVHNDHVADVLFLAARLVRQSGHGGSFWIIRDESSFEGTLNRVDSTGDLFAPLVAAEVRARNENPTLDVAPSLREGSAEDHLRDTEQKAMARSLANLCAMDGAVLITMEPKVVGFGAFFHGKPPPDGVADIVSVSPNISRTEAYGGGRHRSAAAFCSGGGSGDRAAIVVSQDGDISVFFRMSKALQPALWVDSGVARVHLAAVGRGFAFL